MSTNSETAISMYRRSIPTRPQFTFCWGRGKHTYYNFKGMVDTY